jgi:hypothetical protein
MSEPEYYWPTDSDPAMPVSPPSTATGEPVVIAQAVTVLISIAVSAGWIVLDNELIAQIATAVGAIVAIVTTILARARVSPLKGGMIATVQQAVAQVIEPVVADRVRAELAARRSAGRSPRTPREAWRPTP